MNRSIVIDIIKESLWEKINKAVYSKDVSMEEYEELRIHALSLLPAPILPSLSIDDNLQKIWERDIIAQFSYNCRYKFLQDSLPISVPYVILKGTSAAKYYPVPENRIMGDIDIMPSRECMKLACEQLLENGYEEITTKSEQDRGRHRTFMKHGIPVEVHAFFASMNDPEKAKAFDDMIVQNINSLHILPDLFNGMILIEHINQHMEEGVGLRQIIDWMMFVDKCLPDENWSSFQVLLQKTGLEKLAIIVTRMCEIYLGLPSHNWCKGADPSLCADLMDYVFASGSFGNKFSRENELRLDSFSLLKHPFLLIHELQRRGEKDWKYAKKRILKHFAWIWQGAQLSKEIPLLVKGYNNAVKLNKLFDSLEIKKSKRGLVYYEDGKYIKK